MSTALPSGITSSSLELRAFWYWSSRSRSARGISGTPLCKSDGIPGTGAIPGMPLGGASDGPGQLRVVRRGEEVVLLSGRLEAPRDVRPPRRLVALDVRADGTSSEDEQRQRARVGEVELQADVRIDARLAVLPVADHHLRRLDRDGGAEHLAEQAAPCRPAASVLWILERAPAREVGRPRSVAVGDPPRQLRIEAQLGEALESAGDGQQVALQLLPVAFGGCHQDVETDGLLDSERSHPQAAQIAQMRAGPETLPQIVRQGAQ